MPPLTANVPAIATTDATAAPAEFLELPPEVLRIRRLNPLRHLSDKEFLAVARHAHVEQRRAGKTLFRAGVDDQSIFYLLDGEVEICDESGASFRLLGGALETAHPLSPHAKVRCLAVVIKDSCYVRMPAELLQIKHALQPQQGIEVEELSADVCAIDKRVLFAVYHDLMEGNFILPTLPDIALKIRDATADTNRGINEIAKIIKADAGIAAYCIKAANSAAYGGAHPVSGVHDAVVRMGVAATRDLTTAYALKDLYTALDSDTRALMRTAWQHSSHIAALSYVIARHTQRVNPEQALLAGLVHDIGILVLVREWKSYSAAALDRGTLQALGAEFGGTIGSLILRAWGFPDSMVAATLESQHWARYEQETIDLCDCIVLAHAHDPTPPPWSMPTPNIEHIAAYRKLSDGTLSAARHLRVVEEAEQELRAVNQLLGA